MRFAVFVLATTIGCATVQEDTAEPMFPSIAEKTAKMARRDGFVPMYWDDGTGKLWLELSRFDAPMLYQGSLPHGIGSNDIGLDRGQLGATRLVRFVRRGPRILLSQDNLRYRATTDNPLELSAVKQAFATSVLWGFDVGAQTADTVLVDAASFFLRDAHGVVDRRTATQQGSFRVDAKRSAIDLDLTKGFPNNTEVQAIITVVANGGRVGDWVRSRPTPRRSPSGSATRSSRCPTTTTRRGGPIRGLACLP